LPRQVPRPRWKDFTVKQRRARKPAHCRTGKKARAGADQRDHHRARNRRRGRRHQLLSSQTACPLRADDFAHLQRPARGQWSGICRQTTPQPRVRGGGGAEVSKAKPGSRRREEADSSTAGVRLLTSTATKPQVVVFDLGKVLLDFDYGIAAAKIATKGIW